MSKIDVSNQEYMTAKESMALLASMLGEKVSLEKFQKLIKNNSINLYINDDGKIRPFIDADKIGLKFKENATAIISNRNPISTLNPTTGKIEKIDFWPDSSYIRYASIEIYNLAERINAPFRETYELQDKVKELTLQISKLTKENDELKAKLVQDGEGLQKAVHIVIMRGLALCKDNDICKTQEDYINKLFAIWDKPNKNRPHGCEKTTVDKLFAAARKTLKAEEKKLKE